MGFQSRLEHVSKAGLLTTADLATWFGRPYHTVRGWRTNPAHYRPWGPNGREAERLLDLLEHAIKRKRGFPVPINLSPVERRAHVGRMRHELDTRLSKARSAR